MSAQLIRQLHSPDPPFPSILNYRVDLNGKFCAYCTLKDAVCLKGRHEKGTLFHGTWALEEKCLPPIVTEVILGTIKWPEPSEWMVNGLHLHSAFIQSAVQFSHSPIHPFTHTFTHQRRLAAMQGTNQLVRSNWGLGVLLRDTSTHPGWDRTGNPPTVRWQLLPWVIQAWTILQYLL